MARFDAQIEMALRLIAKNGQSVKWKVVRDGTPADPFKPWEPSQPLTPIQHDVTICFLPIDRETRQTISYIRGTEVTTGSTMGYMGLVNFEPSAKDIVIRNGKEMRIETIDILSPNEQTVLYTMIFKA